MTAPLTASKMNKKVIIDRKELKTIGYQAAPLRQILSLKNLSQFEQLVLINFFSNSPNWKISTSSISKQLGKEKSRKRTNKAIDTLKHLKYIFENDGSVVINLNAIQDDYKKFILESKTGIGSTTDTDSTSIGDTISTTDTDSSSMGDTISIRGGDTISIRGGDTISIRGGDTISTSQVIPLVPTSDTISNSLPDTISTTNNINITETEKKEPINENHNANNTTAFQVSVSPCVVLDEFNKSIYFGQGLNLKMVNVYLSQPKEFKTQIVTYLQFEKLFIYTFNLFLKKLNKVINRPSLIRFFNSSEFDPKIILDKITDRDIQYFKSNEDKVTKELKEFQL